MLTHKFRWKWLACLWGALGWSMLTSWAQAADVVVGRVVAASDRIALERIDHSGWDALLEKYVDGQGRVDYATWQRSPADLQALDAYLEHLSASNDQGSRQQRLAFWINAYNAVTIKGILREYPTSSIRNHTPRLFGYNIWKNLKLPVAGKPISLEAMEHSILRQLDEPRIHFAIVCASIGCPRLRDEAYLPQRLDEQLGENTRAFFADPSKFRYDPESETFYLSPILSWFWEDFGGTRPEVLKQISGWLPPAAQPAAAAGRGRIAYLAYDWGLNDRPSNSP